MMKNTEWGAVAYLQHSKYGSGTNVRLNNNSNHITGYSSTQEPACGNLGYDEIDACKTEAIEFCGPSNGSSETCNIYQSTVPGEDKQYTVNYFNSLAINSSTTGNITGIYDMSGGSWEYMMNVMVDSQNTPIIGYSGNEHSNFNGKCKNGDVVSSGLELPQNKYYDLYIYSTSNQ